MSVAARQEAASAGVGAAERSNEAGRTASVRRRDNVLGETANQRARRMCSRPPQHIAGHARFPDVTSLQEIPNLGRSVSRISARRLRNRIGSEKAGCGTMVRGPAVLWPGIVLIEPRPHILRQAAESKKHRSSMNGYLHFFLYEIAARIVGAYLVRRQLSPGFGAASRDRKIAVYSSSWLDWSSRTLPRGIPSQSCSGCKWASRHLPWLHASRLRSSAGFQNN